MPGCSAAHMSLQEEFTHNRQEICSFVINGLEIMKSYSDTKKRRVPAILVISSTLVPQKEVEINLQQEHMCTLQQQNKRSK